jgi:hypothetical protein
MFPISTGFIKTARFPIRRFPGGSSCCFRFLFPCLGCGG